jgi:flagellar basal body-associated protein FliL
MAGNEKAAVPRAGKRKGTLVIVGAAVLVLGGTAALVRLRSAEPRAGQLEIQRELAHRPENPGIVQFESFVVNLADVEGDRFMRVTLRVVLRDEDDASAARGDELLLTKIRHQMMATMSSRQAQDVVDFEGKERLRRDLKDALRPLFDEDEFVDLLFTGFLVQ